MVVAGGWVTSLGEFAVVDNQGVPRPASELGFTVEHEDGEPILPDENGLLLVAPTPGSNGGVVGRVATTMEAETFSFGAWTVTFDLRGGLDESTCDITFPLTFGTNGSNVVMFPDGEEPVPTPTVETDVGTHTDDQWIAWWRDYCRCFPWDDECAGRLITSLVT